MRLTGRAAAVWFAILTGLVTASASSAQTPSAAVRVGDRVRLTAPTIESSPIIGRVVSVDSAQLTVDVAKKGDAPSERRIDREALDRIERSTGFQSHVGKGALIGAGIGVLAGAGALYLIMEESGEGPFPITLPLWYGAIGTLVGAGVGGAVSGERWSTLPSDARVGMQLGSRSGPLAVGIRVSF